MSPMRQLTEAVHRVPSVQDINVEGTMENLPDTPINDQWDDSIDVTPELNQPIGDNIPTTMEQPLNERENAFRDPEFVAERVSLLDEGPPNSQQETVTPITNSGTATSMTAPTGPISTEAVSMFSTPPVSSTGMEERIPLNDPIHLTEEDPQRRCTVCNTIDCMVHNPRHRYCMDCGQRLLGPHTCSNQIEHTDTSRTQNPIRTDEIQPMGPDNYNSEILLPRHFEPNVGVLEDRVSGNNPLRNRDPIMRQIPTSSVPSETCHNDLPTYEEAVTPDPDYPTRTRLVPNMQNVLHHIDYSSDPEEARIHFKILSPTRPLRSQSRNVNPQRERWRYPPAFHDHIYCDKIEVRPSPRTVKYSIPHRTCMRCHQAPGGDGGSSPGDKDNSLSERSSNR